MKYISVITTNSLQHNPNELGSSASFAVNPDGSVRMMSAMRHGQTIQITESMAKELVELLQQGNPKFVIPDDKALNEDGFYVHYEPALDKNMRMEWVKKNG